MSIYFIRATIDDINQDFAFDSTSEVSVSRSGSATSFPVEEGFEVSDHYVNRNTTIRFSGIITDVKSRTENADGSYSVSSTHATTQDFINQISELKERGIPFSINVNSKLKSLDNCVFESLDITQDKTNGSSGGVNSYKISFTAKQIKFSSRAKLTIERDPQIKNQVDTKKTESGKVVTKSEINIVSYSPTRDRSYAGLQ